MINSNNKKSNNDEKSKKDKAIITKEELFKDAQLKSATDIIKVLIITNKQEEIK